MANFGPAATRFVERVRVRHAVLSIGAIAADDGFMDFHLDEAEFSRAVIARANRVMVVADHTKFATQAPVQVCEFSEVGALITDQPPPAAVARRLDEAGVQVTIAA
jgi:DeoR family glycerol-3-phosphate regulon repressor